MGGGQLCRQGIGWRHATRPLLRLDPKPQDKLRSKVQFRIVAELTFTASGADYARRGSPPYVNVAYANGASPGSNLVKPPAVLDVHLLVQKLEFVPQTAEGKLLVNAGILRHPEHPLGALGSYHAHGEHCRPTGESPLRLLPSKYGR